MGIFSRRGTIERLETTTMGDDRKRLETTALEETEYID